MPVELFDGAREESVEALHFGPRSLSRGETALAMPVRKPAHGQQGKARHGTELCPMMGGQEIWSICRMLGWHPISSQSSSGQAGAHRLPDSHILGIGARARAIDGTGPDRLPGAELRGLSDGAMAGG